VGAHNRSAIDTLVRVATDPDLKKQVGVDE
jgi:hypothetical protein